MRNETQNVLPQGILPGEVSGVSEKERNSLHYTGDSPTRLPREPGKVFTLDDTQISHRILIIKLGEVGDVIRTTPILHRLKKEYPSSQITWITKFPSVLPTDYVDIILPFGTASILRIRNTQYDIAFNFDKDRESCGLMNEVHAKVKKGFWLVNGNPYPIDKDSVEKFRLGLDDDFAKAYTKSYPEQVFGMAGYRFNREEYLINNMFKKGKALIGLNTGAGVRWSSRLWKEEYWIDLVRALKKEGYQVMLLGGETEHAKNLRIVRSTDALYLGCHPIDVFVTLINFCDIIVTTVTMALHVAVALKKRIVLFNNVFNRHEFELYGQGLILEPDQACQCFYRQECDQPQRCMDRITVPVVLKAIEDVQKLKIREQQ